MIVLGSSCRYLVHGTCRIPHYETSGHVAMRNITFLYDNQHGLLDSVYRQAGGGASGQC